MTEPTGYHHPIYGKSFSESGVPRLLPRSQGWILQRRIPGTEYEDAMGLYPFLCCRDWKGLGADVEDLEDRFVSICLVVDPFANPSDVANLRRWFPDRFAEFKQHHVTDLNQDPSQFVSTSHQRNIRRASGVVVEACEPPDYLDDWVRLYDNLVARHRIAGITRFSRDSFLQQLAVPGCVAYRAQHGQETIGMTLWYLHGDVAYYHLGAYSDEGYNARASFALFGHTLKDMPRRRVRWLSLGAGAGLADRDDSGLSRFKRGWATGCRPTYILGRIFHRERYAQLTASRNPRGVPHFPAYRAGEF